MGLVDQRPGASAAREMYPGYERWPSYRALLDREGLKDMGDLVISRDEKPICVPPGCGRRSLGPARLL